MDLYDFRYNWLTEQFEVDVETKRLILAVIEYTDFETARKILDDTTLNITDDELKMLKEGKKK